MAKYLVLYEGDTSKTPEDSKAKKAQWLAALGLVKTKLKEGVIKEWGAFAGEFAGYMIVEGTAVDLHSLTSLWIPLVKFTAHEVLTVDEITKAIKALPE